MTHIVIISTADWDHPIWTNKQHVACSLANQGHTILYVESLGLRGANNSGKDLSRIFRRLIKGLSPPKRVRQNIWVLSPLVIPGASNSIVLTINRYILNISIKLSLYFSRMSREWLWTYNPMTLKYIDLGKFYKSIYHAVDAIHEQPGMPKKLIKEEERKLCREVDHVFATSPQIKKELEPFSNNIKYESNCCDYEHFSRALTIDGENIPNDLLVIPKPIIGFIGAISNYKLDFDLIKSVAIQAKNWNFVFIGPTCEGEKDTDISMLKSIPNIHFLGYRKYKYLPNYCAGFDVGWLPLRFNKYTQSMFPMKFFEYLAAGLPVVASSIDSLNEFRKEAALCNSSAKCFLDAINLSLSDKSLNLKDRLELAKLHTYEKRTLRMVQKIINR